ncbi:hypothetical protein ACLOJK_009694 [Asimina triloba]
MDSGGANLEERLRSFVAQLRIELGILDRIVYKGKNQHRRCLYFKYLLKVRRDAKLLLSANLEDVFSFLFQVVDGKKPTKKVSHLESQISSLLAQSFFMTFSLTNLAILARLRVLVQQMLLDAVTLFNKVSSISQEEQSVKLSQEGIEVIREYHPPGGDFLYLECKWKKDMFVLHERVSKSKRNFQSMDIEEGGSIPPETIQYERIELSNEDDELACGDHLGAMNITTHPAEAIPIQPVEFVSGGMADNGGEGTEIDGQRSPKDSTAASLSSLTSTALQKCRTQDTKKVAFVAVRKSDPSEPDEAGPNKKLKVDGGTSDSNDVRDFFSLLTGGGVKDSLF